MVRHGYIAPTSSQYSWWVAKWQHAGVLSEHVLHSAHIRDNVHTIASQMCLIWYFDGAWRGQSAWYIANMRRVFAPLLVGTVVLFACKVERASEVPDSRGNGDGGLEAQVEPIVTPDANEGTFVAEIGVCPFERNAVPPLKKVADDSKIPQFQRARSRGANEEAGNAAPRDHELHAQLRAMHPRIFECLDLASCYTEDQIGAGELQFKFELEPSGDVRGVTVTTSDTLAYEGLIPCARKSLYEFHFQPYDGSRMVVNYRIEID